ncbi:MAG TPA: response regulator [Chloroflexi bacterium]|nr:response regulator [Chloroflexota bacterium]
MAIDRMMKILLVEDSGFVRMSEKKALNKLGFEHIIEAQDGEEAIQKLQEQDDVQLIISDWIMPNVDGYALLLWVRENEVYQDTPFIMATALGEKKQASKALEAGVTNFITKPFDASELEVLIEKFFGAVEPPEPKPVHPRRTTTGKLVLNVAHIQITDHLSLGVLKHLIETGDVVPTHFELKTACKPSWNPAQEALERGEVDAAFVLAPIAMDLFRFGAPIRLVLSAQKNGSILVRKREDGAEDLAQYFRGKTVYIPHELSVHHMLAHMFLSGIGLNPGFEGLGDFDTYFEVIPPIQMPEFLAANPNAGGFAVAEPLGAKAISEGIADRVFLSGQFWENHPCCVIAMREEIIEQEPDAVQEFVNLLVEAGQFIEENPDIAATVGVPFLDPDQTLGLRKNMLKSVLEETQGIKTNDMRPTLEDFDSIQRYMTDEMGIGSVIDLETFIDARFAEEACQDLPRQKSVLHDVSDIIHA